MTSQHLVNRVFAMKWPSVTVWPPVDRRSTIHPSEPGDVVILGLSKGTRESRRSLPRQHYVATAHDERPTRIHTTQFCPAAKRGDGASARREPQEEVGVCGVIF